MTPETSPPIDNKNDLLNASLGTAEPPRLEPKEVTITSVDLENNDKFKTLQLVLMVLHPDKTEPIQIYRLEYIKAKKVKDVGMTVYFDNEGKVLKTSGIGELMRITGATSLKDLVGKKIQTELNKEGFLILKAH